MEKLEHLNDIPFSVGDLITTDSPYLSALSGKSFRIERINSCHSKCDITEKCRYRHMVVSIRDSNPPYRSTHNLCLGIKKLYWRKVNESIH